jgi:hypothetical protein
MRLDADQQEEIIAELAGHLEDVYENFLEQGICAEKAEEQAWREVSRGRKLARKIRRAKQGGENMSNRVKQFWLPALMTSLIGTGVLAVMQQWGLRPMVLRVPMESPATFYFPWLLTLPFLGFLGAFWSRREGGAISTRIAAGTFLSLIYFTVPWLFVPIAIVFDHETPHMVPFAWFLLNWAAVPCIALLIGVLPATFSAQKSRAESRSAA